MVLAWWRERTKERGRYRSMTAGLAGPEPGVSLTFQRSVSGSPAGLDPAALRCEFRARQPHMHLNLDGQGFTRLSPESLFAELTAFFVAGRVGGGHRPPIELRDIWYKFRHPHYNDFPVATTGRRGDET